MTETTEPQETRLTPTLRELLSDTIDYAGIFPPAELPLREAIQNYAQYRHTPESWLLARFVIPVGRLDELDVFSKLFRESSPFHLSALGQSGADAEAFLSAFTDDLDTIEAFHDRHDDRAHVDVMEMPLPPALLDADIPTATDFFEEVYRHLIRQGIAQLDLFYEIPLEDDTMDAVPALLAAMADHNSQRTLPARSEIGLKIRCGGMTPADIPAAPHVARAIAGCRDAGVRFKATAGLHHPIYHYDDTMESMMHGFINIFGASVLALEHGLSPGDIEAILTEESADRFHFKKDTFAWGGLTASLDAIHHARSQLVTSFGSCSFTEPRDDLKELELL